MKILVFADIHGSLDGANLAVQISQREQPQKTVFCGDLFGGWGGNGNKVGQVIAQTQGVLYFVRGNNDYPSDQLFLPFGMEENALMYHFGRTLFFTHGDRYNGLVFPPVLQQNDALVFGHTHVCRLGKRNGLHLINVGSLCRPRDGVASYVVLDDNGATAKDTSGNVICFHAWD